MSFWDGTQWVTETREVAKPPPAPVRPSRAKHLAGAVAEGALIAALTFGLIAGSAFAGKGGAAGKGGSGDGSSSLALVMVDDAGGDGGPSWNDEVTFDVSTTATLKPWVKLDCYQDGTWVSTSTAGFFEAYAWDPNFVLASGGWQSGAADCTATLYKVTSNGRSRTLATMSFHVEA